MSDKNNTSNSVGLTTIIFLIFLILKLTGNINWSWWWVFSPFWIPLALALGFLIIVLFIYVLYLAFTGKKLTDLF